MAERKRAALELEDARQPRPGSSRRRSRERSTGTSATTCCGWCSSPAIRCSPPRPGSRSPSGCSAASPPTRSPAPSCPRSPPSPSGSSGPSGRWPRRRCRSRSRAAPSCAARLSSVLEVLYLVFNEGYSATAGDDWMRPRCANDALRLGRILAELVPGEPEVHGAGRADGDPGLPRRPRRPDGRADPARSTRTGRAGTSCLIRRGLAALDAAEASTAAPGPYALQAAIAACHARARDAPTETDWQRIAALYDDLRRLTPSPVVELNRAVAVSHGVRPGGRARPAGRADAIRRSARYHLLPSVPRRPPARLGPARRGGAGGVRARGGSHPERPAAGAAGGPRRRLPPLDGRSQDFDGAFARGDTPRMRHLLLGIAALGIGCAARNPIPSSLTTTTPVAAAAEFAMTTYVDESTRTHGVVCVELDRAEDPANVLERLAPLAKRLSADRNDCAGRDEPSRNPLHRPATGRGGAGAGGRGSRARQRRDARARASPGRLAGRPRDQSLDLLFGSGGTGAMS